MQYHFVYQNLKREIVLKREKNRFTPPFYPLKNFTNLKKNKKVFHRIEIIQKHYGQKGQND
jgi:hypothetical protein